MLQLHIRIKACADWARAGHAGEEAYGPERRRFRGLHAVSCRRLRQPEYGRVLLHPGVRPPYGLFVALQDSELAKDLVRCYAELWLKREPEA